jgi:hypothetical protein
MSIRFGLLSLVVALGLSATDARGAEPSVVERLSGDTAALGNGVAKSLDLKSQLEKALKARLPSDYTFIATVVRQVERGRLPRKLVDQTLGYARAKSQQNPFIYFQFALRKQAEMIGETA